MEALLRRQMPGGAGSSDACPDAETLAAWTDGGLDARAQAQVEAHAAGCARCQALMAAIVKSESAPPTIAVEPWWHRWSLRWLVPLTAAAAATLVWMLVPGDERPDNPIEQEFTQARAESAAPAPPTAESPATPTPAAEAPAAEMKKAAPSTLRKEESDTAEARPPAAETGYVARQATPAEAPPARADADREAAQAATASGALGEAVGAERRSAESPAAPPAPTAAAPAAQAQAAPKAGTALSARGALADANTVTAGIVSRDPAVRWRLAGPGAVERSADAGSSWTRLETGVATPFTAGSAPSGSVCWLVGRGGLVLLTTDAHTWRRVTSPAVSDLIAVDATDATTATVRTVNGRAFRTTDGGATWVATP